MSRRARNRAPSPQAGQHGAVAASHGAGTTPSGKPRGHSGRLRQRLHRDEGGQTITEYSLLMAVVGGGFAYTAIEFLPNFIHALRRYYDGFYIMLKMPFP